MATILWLPMFESFDDTSLYIVMATILWLPLSKFTQINNYRSFWQNINDMPIAHFYQFEKIGLLYHFRENIDNIPTVYFYKFK